MSNSFAAPWTVACQAPLSVAFPSHEYWSGLLFPSPGDLPNPRTEPISPALAGEFFTTEPPGKPFNILSLFFMEVKRKKKKKESERSGGKEKSRDERKIERVLERGVSS